VFVARGVFPRSTPCVCALRGFLPGRVFPDRTTRRHDLARLPPYWVGLAGRAVTVRTVRSRTCYRVCPQRDSTRLPWTRIPVPGIETRASEALEAASPAEAPMGALTPQEIILGQAEDAFCQERLKELDVLSPPDPKWSRKAFFFREKNGLLCHHSVYGRETQVVILEALKQSLLRYQHQSVLAGYPGSRRMYDTFCRYVYWPTMVVDVQKHVEQCPACAKNLLSERRYTSTMKLCPALEPFSGLAMDLLGPLTTSRGGHKHVVVIYYRFTKLTRAIPLRDATALTVSSAFIDTWVTPYGIPDSVLTDNGPQFASVYYQGILGLLGIASN